MMKLDVLPNNNIMINYITYFYLLFPICQVKVSVGINGYYG